MSAVFPSFAVGLLARCESGLCLDEQVADRIRLNQNIIDGRLGFEPDRFDVRRAQAQLGIKRTFSQELAKMASSWASNPTAAAIAWPPPAASISSLSGPLMLLIVVFNLERHAVKAGPPVANEYIVVLSQRT